jgi:uncharacterized hydrophobic protein (TIGR00271 family)
MLLVRIVAPVDTAPKVLAYLEGLPEVTDLVHLPGAGRRPPGDLIQCTLAVSSGSPVVTALAELGVTAHGSITLDRLDAAVSAASDRAGAAAEGATADAVVWEEVEDRVATMAELSVAFLTYMMVATVIAVVGILTDSLVLIVGAMVVGPEFGPLAALCVGLVQRKPSLARQGLTSLALGFAAAIAAAIVAAWAFRATGLAPADLTASMHPDTLFISRPDSFAVIIAAAAGVAGMLSLTTASSGTLIGVLISVTTIPAAANAGVAVAYGAGAEVRGAAVQLALNLAVMVIAGLATLAVQRAAFTRRVSRALDRVARLTAGRGYRRR